MVSSGRFVSTTTVRADEGWQEQVSRLHGQFKIDVPRHAARYTGTIQWHLGQRYRLLRWSGEAERLTRGASEVKSDPVSMYELVVPLAGEPVIESGVRDIRLSPGEMALVRLDTAISVVHTDPCTALALLIPESEIAARVPRSVPLMHIDRRSGLGAVGFEAARGLLSEASGLTDAMFDAAARHVLDLLLLASRGEAGARDATGEIDAAIRGYVRQHAGSADLDLTSIARALGWSVRRIQQVLRLSGTTATELIRTERLGLAQTLLASQDGRRLSISDIAFMCGFSSHSSFCRAFRSDLGLSPSDFRAQGPDAAADAVSPVVTPRR
ncbi:AraC family transcriptional regulator [Tsukamurella spumae]|uniref:AraC family transcriptional regulator n=1 Tax=Tsukamurella spumae TaxID=44753 RepID=A0A846WZ78_9ACTN|nr:AraC family transcriptional regulator [Tsukamurella spumae]NKY17322.1 AraC family transcriptional regulator [Tsukamurella spumae]